MLNRRAGEVLMLQEPMMLGLAESAMHRISLVGGGNGLSDQVKDDILAHGSALTEVLLTRLRAAMRHEIDAYRIALRALGLRQSLRGRSTPLTVADLEPAINRTSSERNVRLSTRGALLLGYADAVVLALHSAGKRSIEVVRPSRGGERIRLAISQDDAHASYLEKRGELFHPNSRSHFDWGTAL